MADVLVEYEVPFEVRAGNAVLEGVAEGEVLVEGFPDEGGVLDLGEMDLGEFELVVSPELLLDGGATELAWRFRWPRFKWPKFRIKPVRHRTRFKVKWPKVRFRWPRFRWRFRWPKFRLPRVRLPRIRFRWPKIRWPKFRWPRINWPKVSRAIRRGLIIAGACVAGVAGIALAVKLAPTIRAARVAKTVGR